MAKYSETIGYIIHTRPFKDSSLIIEFFSQENGMMQFVAKGIKKNKNLKSQLQFFNLLTIQYFGKSNLKTLSSLNVLENLQLVDLPHRMAAMYLNELLHLSLVEGEKAQQLFNVYRYSLNQFGKVKLSYLLRNFEFQLLKQNGFELSVSHFSDAESWLTIDEVRGLITTTQQSLKMCLVSDLSAFIDKNPLNQTQLKNINKLMFAAINMNLSYKKVYSRDLLVSILSQ